MEPPIIIRFSKVTVAYPETVALRNITYEIKSGEFIGIIGPNGSGKTTLLKTILGLVKPVEGEVEVFQSPVGKNHRRRIGYVPQRKPIDPHFPLKVFDAVLMGTYSSIGLFKRPSSEHKKRTIQALEMVDMLKFANHIVGHLSGGQQQRVLIARALAGNPQILLLDEPTSGVDVATQQSIVNLIHKLHQAQKLTTLFVTHDINPIFSYLDRVMYLNQKIYAFGEPGEILNEERLRAFYQSEVIIYRHRERSYVIVGDRHA